MKKIDGKNMLKIYDNFKKYKDVDSSLIFKQENIDISDIDFTIAIPTFNRIDTLKEAIDSALNQDVNMQYEIIVVENCNDIGGGQQDTKLSRI